MFLPRPQKIEDTVLHVTGGEAKLLGRIVHQDLERIVYLERIFYRGLWFVCIDQVFVLIGGRRVDAVGHLVVILLLRLHHFLPLRLSLKNPQYSVDRWIVDGGECRATKEWEALFQPAS